MDAYLREVLVGPLLFSLVHVKNGNSTLSCLEKCTLFTSPTTGKFSPTHRLSHQLICVEIWIKGPIFSPLSICNTEDLAVLSPSTQPLWKAQTLVTFFTIPCFAIALRKWHHLVLNICTLGVRPPGPPTPCLSSGSRWMSVA